MLWTSGDGVDYTNFVGANLNGSTCTNEIKCGLESIGICQN